MKKVRSAIGWLGWMAAAFSLATPGSAVQQDEQAPNPQVLLPAVPETVLRPMFLDVEGVNRRFYLHLPNGYDTKRKAPLVILLHGMGGTPAGVFLYTKMGVKSDDTGFVLACPEAAGELRAWAVGYNTGMKDNSDILFIKRMIDVLERTYAIDPDRVYIAGHSSGGMLAYRLASEISDRIAAIGVAAATIGAHHEDGTTTIISPPANPVSVIAFHGTLDPINPYAIEDKWAFNANFLPVADAITFWVKADGCTLDGKRTIFPGGVVVRDAYSGGKGGSDVVLYSIVGGDHWWPGDKDDAPYIAAADEAADATGLMWSFFSRHTRITAAKTPPKTANAIDGKAGGSEH